MADKKTVVTESMLTILRRPLITEKTSRMSEGGNWVAFEVPVTSNKDAIKCAVEALYSVKVERVNTSVTKGKVKRFRGITGRRNNMKKAFVRLASGYSIDVSSGV